MWRKRIVWEITLKPEEDALGDLLKVAEASSLKTSGMDAASTLLDGGEMMLLSVPAEHTNDLWMGIAGTNVTVYVPEGFTNRVEIYSTTNLLDSNGWSIAVQNLLPVHTNPATWTTSGSEPVRFFRCGNMDVDTDGDSLPDSREVVIYKTLSGNADSDGDSMADGWEVNNSLNPLSAGDQVADPDHDMLPNVYEWYYGLNPNSADSESAPRLRVDPSNVSESNTYASIEEALSASSPYSIIEVADGLYEESDTVFPAHPVLLMSENWGLSRGVKINSEGFAAFMLSDGQDNRTIIRGLNIMLTGNSSRQFGFYLGDGCAPFAGAAPFFDGIKIQLGTSDWSGGFYGLGSANESILFNNCIIRGSGTDNTLSGIYLVDAPNVRVVNCSFLNFNISSNLSSGILLGSSSINIGGAAALTEAQIDNCFWDESFSSNNNYAVVHALDSGSHYQTTVSYAVVPDSSRLLGIDSEVSVIEASVSALQDGLILSNSPCRDASGPNLLSWYDFHGQSRDGAPDIGADEYSAISTNDADHDGLDDYTEAFVCETFVFDYDSDGDRVGDGDEMACGTDPNNKTNYCVTIMGTVDDQTGLNVPVRASYALGSQTWNSINAVTVSSGQFSYSHQVINSSQSIIVQVLIDLNGNGTLDSGEPYYTSALHITNHDSGIEFLLKDKDSDGVDDYDEVNCGTDPNNVGEYCISLQGVVTNQTTLPGIMYAAAILRKETLPPFPSDLNDPDYQSIALAQMEVATNGIFSLNHVVVQPNTNDLSKLWLVVYQDTLTNSVADYFEPMTQILVTPTNHTMNYQISAPEGVYDGDRDNIPDWWEAWNGLSFTNQADAYEDPDGDWVYNLWEYRLDLDPHTYNANNYAFVDATRAIDSRIAGLDPTNAIHIFNEDCYETTNFVRNTNCWAYAYDLTCISPWQSYSDSNGGHNCRAGTLITPRHILLAGHYWIFTNTVIRFIDNQNNVIDRTLIRYKHHPDYGTEFAYYPDFCVGILDADVPTNCISIAKVLPDDYADYLGDGFGTPALRLDQEEKALVGDIYNINQVTPFPAVTTTVYQAVFQLPVQNQRILFYENIIRGDSGNPACIFINQIPVLLTVWIGGDGGSGTSVVAFKADLNQMISDLNALCGVTNEYQLTEIDLSLFDKLK